MKNRKYYASIDIFKYICALVIADYHIRLLGIENSFLCELSRFALYFFHCSCGYFFMISLKNNENVLNKNVKRLISPLLFWICIYFFINLYNDVLAGSQEFDVFMLYQLKSLFINGTGFHLWFIAALMIYMFITSRLYNLKKHNLLYFVSIVLYIIGLLGSYYYPLGNKIPIVQSIINFNYFPTFARVFLNGLPLFSTGVFIADREKFLSNISNNRLITLIVLALLLSFTEIYIVLNYFVIRTNINTLGLFVLLVPVFIFLKNNPMDYCSNISKPLKYVSSFIYYSHPLFRTVLASLFMRIFNIQLSSMLMSIIVVVLCSFCGYILYKINNKHINKVCS